MFFHPRLGDPVAFVEELPYYHFIIVKDILGHPHPVNFDVRRDVLPSPDDVAVDRPIVGDDDGDHFGFRQPFSETVRSYSRKLVEEMSVDEHCHSFKHTSDALHFHYPYLDPHRPIFELTILSGRLIFFDFILSIVVIFDIFHKKKHE